MLELTNEMIRSDIAGYEQRIEMAKQKLVELPSWAASWKERKKLQDIKRALEGEVRHVRHLIRHATEALNEQAYYDYLDRHVGRL